MGVQLEWSDVQTRSTEKPRPGPEAVREARAQWRRAEIVEAATRLMEDCGFHRMTVSALAREAGLSVGTIYHYVEDKSDILLLVILDILDAYRQDLPLAMEGHTDPVERLAAGFDAYCRIVDSRRYAIVLTYRESKSLPEEGRKRIMALEVETSGLLRECLEEAQSAGLVVACDTELIAHNLTVLAHAWALKHWRLKGHVDLGTYIAAETGLTVKAIVAPGQEKRYEALTRAAVGETTRRPRRRPAASSAPRRR
jgi:TetR/AcrR family transcriptional regulator, cholesterol catabolism regulator